MNIKKLISALFLLLVGTTATLVAQTAVTVGSQVTSENDIVSGKAYLIKYTSMTGTPYIYDAGASTPLQAPSTQNSPTTACVFYFISDGNGSFKIENAYSGLYWPAPTGNERLYPTTANNAGSWSISISGGTATMTCTNGATTYGLDRLTPDVVGWNSRKTVEIYTVEAADLATASSYSSFADKDINVSTTEAASISEGQWYVMKNRGRNGYAYEDGGSMKNQAEAPAGSATNNAKFFVRLLNAGGDKYYLQNGLGNYFGVIPDNTAVPTTAVGTEKYTIGKINSTDGHFYLTSETGNYVLDCQENGNPVVGWGTEIPTSTGGNNDWAFYPVEFVEAWIPTTSEVYTINNTNTSRGALIYNPDASTTYVWSSGKSGTFDATNANSQWVIIPSGTAKQYFLYNVGAGKFAIPSGIANGAGSPWMFSDNAVAMVFETQGNGTKKIKMATNPVSGSNAAYISVSNGQTNPIINYNDAGSEFTITKVTGDASTAANAAVAKLVKSQTALSAVPSDDGWYVMRTKDSGTASHIGRYVFAPEEGVNYGSTNYPLSFTGDVAVEPAINDVTYYVRFSKSGSSFNWQVPNGRYMAVSGTTFPRNSVVAANITLGYSNGITVKSGSYWAIPYNDKGAYILGGSSSTSRTYDIYPIDLAAVGLTAWQVLCNDAPETAQITCSLSDVSGLTSVYKNGYFFLPIGVTPATTDFTLEGATGITVDATNHTVTLDYDPNLAIMANDVSVAQGWQTAGRDGEVMLLRVNAAPFAAATGATLNVSLLDGAESNISALTLYEASSDSPEILSAGNSGAPTKTQLATTSVSGATATLSIGNLSVGTHYYWIGATLKSDATLGAVLDAAVTGITYICNGEEKTLDLTSVGNPADRGAMVFNVHSYPFLPRDNGSRVYRIPAMVVAKDGSIVVACDKRYESHSDIGGGHVIDIVVRRSTDGGKTWGSPVVVAKGDNSNNATCGYGDPSLYKDNDGTLYLLFAAGNTGYFNGLNRVCMATSSDNGATWSAPVDLYETRKMIDHASSYGSNTCYGLYDYFVTSGRGLCTSEGYLMALLPAQAYTNEGHTNHTDNSQDYIFYSTDQGATWHISENAIFAGGDEAKVIQANDGSLIASVRQGGARGFSTATYTANNDGTLTFNMGTQTNNSQLNTGAANNQDILYYQRETKTGKTDVIFHSMTTGQHANFKLYYSTDGGANWTEFLTVQTKGTRYVTMERSGSEENPGSLYLFFEDQSLNEAGGNYDYNHYPLNFIEITREQLESLIPTLNDLNVPEYMKSKDVKVVYSTSGETNYGSWSGSTWTSSKASGVAGLTMTLSDGSHDMFSSLNGNYNLAYHPAAANTNSTITLTAPAGYVITGFSAQTGVYQAATYTLTVNGNQVTPANLGSNYTPIEVSGLSATSAVITVSTTDASKWLCLANFTVTLAKPLPLNVVGNASYATLYLPCDVTTDGTTKAYYIATADNGYAQLTPTGNGGTEIPANTAVVLINEEAAAITIFNVSSGLSPVVTEDANLLKGTLVDMTLDLSSESNNYSLGRKMDSNGDYQVGFYKSTSGTLLLGANKAYLQTPSEPDQTVKGFTFKFGEIVDGIDSLERQQPDGVIYDLSGRRIAKPSRGLYIVNGKKVAIK